MDLAVNKILEEVKKYPGKKVKLAITDIDGILRGKIISIDKFLSILESGLGFCNVVFGWDSSDTCYNNSKYTGWHSGYPDALAHVDLKTYRQIPWDSKMPFFLADFQGQNKKGLEVCPRSLLRKIKIECESLNYSSVFAQEFEWFNFRENSEELNDSGFHRPEPLTRGMFGYSLLRSSQNKDFFNDLFDDLTQFKIPIEGIHTETGPGVYEAAILYSDILEAADRATLFKASVKEIGHLHGIIPTFMAKWSNDFPGCGGHLHQSLWQDGKNVFFDQKSPDKMSEIMKSYMAGILHCLPHILPLYAPTVNSFKRLVQGAWAPTTLTWAKDNRTVALRALPGSEKSTRMELRVVGSDVNPYLAMAGSLASGMYGIKNKLKLGIPETIGNGYEDLSNGILSKDLEKSTEIMRESELAKELFGETFVDHFTKTREWEWKQYAHNVTDWELKRYFEII